MRKNIILLSLVVSFIIPSVYAQSPVTGQRGIIDTLIQQTIGLIPFILFLVFYPRLMVTQMMFRLEKSVELLSNLTQKGTNRVLKKIMKRPDEKLKKTVRHFMEFFAIEPVSRDPYRIMKKLEHLIDLEKDRFEYFVEQIAPNLNKEEQANVMMGLSASITLYQITKIVRHYVELIKKTKSFNYAMILQMMLPLIERMAKALEMGTEALTNGWAIGDTVGPFVAANLIDGSRVKEADKDTIVSRKKYKGKDIIIIKAKGPGGRTGNPGRVIDRISKKEKIAKIITIDAAAKLEGEKTGSIAEGIGVAIGGIGVEKSHIEEVAVKKKIPLDSIIIKMSQEEAIMPMKKPVLDATPKVLELLGETINRTKEKGKIIVVGVGNTSGVGNSKKDAELAKKNIIKIVKKIKIREKKKKKRFRLPFDF